MIEKTESGDRLAESQKDNFFPKNWPNGYTKQNFH